MKKKERVITSFRHLTNTPQTCSGNTSKIYWTPHSKERTDELESDHEQGMTQRSTCICTSHWDCLMQLICYHNHDASPSADQEEWHCLACQVLSEIIGATGNKLGVDGRRAKYGWSAGSQHGKQQRLSGQTLTRYVKMAEEYETSTMSTFGIRVEPTGKNMDNLTRQGSEDPNRHTPQWKSTLGKHVRDKVRFGMQPTDP